GYPDGLSGDALSLPLRCLSVSDVYDALTSDRSYRKALAHEEAFRVLREEASVGMWDLRIVDLLADVVARG
ncbi:MAG TPA: HD domain-containing phosphohydrolase, partial [Vicinamibacteria bacterium]|nr:HD domain-containing phosphohydrolase [Vicinamibacteria bacterium]